MNHYPEAEAVKAGVSPATFSALSSSWSSCSVNGRSIATCACCCARYTVNSCSSSALIAASSVRNLATVASSCPFISGYRAASSSLR